MFHKHRSFFPLVLALLTLGLLVFMASALWERFENGPSSSRQVPVVTEQGYRQEAQPILRAFASSFAASTTDDEKRVAVESAYNGMLALTVPADYRDLHFGIVSSLYLMREGLYGDAATFDTGWAQLQTILSDNPWLQ